MISASVSSRPGRASGAPTVAPAGRPDDDGGYLHAWEREEVFRQEHNRVAREYNLESVYRATATWAQASDGPADDLRRLASAFHTLRTNGRISRFPDRGIVSARQGTACPYGLPAMLVHLEGTCRVYAERLGRALLEGTPRVVAITGVTPGVVLVENTPPLDNIWDESLFWQAWRTLPEEAWRGVIAWAAVRVLRYVETPEGQWRFYNQASSSPRPAGRPGDPPPWPDVPWSPQLERWRTRRICEITLALEPKDEEDGGLAAHVLGRLATPHPFPEPASGFGARVAAIEDYLTRAAIALRGASRDSGRPAAAEAREGLIELRSVLLKSGGPGEIIACAGRRELGAAAGCQL